MCSLSDLYCVMKPVPERRYQVRTANSSLPFSTHAHCGGRNLRSPPVQTCSGKPSGRLTYTARCEHIFEAPSHWNSMPAPLAGMPLGSSCAETARESSHQWRHVSQVLERCPAVQGPIVTLNGSFCAQVTAWRIISLEDERASVGGGASLELTG